jgi:hypothetical protein
MQLAEGQSILGVVIGQPELFDWEKDDWGAPTDCLMSWEKALPYLKHRFEG